MLLVSVSAKEVAYDLEANYAKKEQNIAMRDGINLHTTIYFLKDKSKRYPIILIRTPISFKLYGENNHPTKLGPNQFTMEGGYVFVYQDKRGRSNSEGVLW
jgi:predicted acyl esterase